MVSVLALILSFTSPSNAATSLSCESNFVKAPANSEAALKQNRETLSSLTLELSKKVDALTETQFQNSVIGDELHKKLIEGQLHKFISENQKFSNTDYFDERFVEYEILNDYIQRLDSSDRVIDPNYASLKKLKYSVRGVLRGYAKAALRHVEDARISPKKGASTLGKPIVPFFDNNAASRLTALIYLKEKLRSILLEIQDGTDDKDLPGLAFEVELIINFVYDHYSSE